MSPEPSNEKPLPWKEYAGTNTQRAKRQCQLHANAIEAGRAPLSIDVKKAAEEIAAKSVFANESAERNYFKMVEEVLTRHLSPVDPTLPDSVHNHPSGILTDAALTLQDGTGKSNNERKGKQ
jgi:hypothetical protein